ncbi:hypothetical protein GCM10007362_39050 [Saccharibacillus endophyticus]|uniref:Uncharacterized protein n=1 Tax=Saccharibacillus endophyticus TaxID=2060666 RepID=A0ABQ2A5A4_9BACL|nr:hypothetical protein GCM10007362_39050 [Saccharibacillus endophyticus]
MDSHLILGAAREINGFEFAGSAGAGEGMIGRRFAPAVAMTLNMGVALFPVFPRRIRQISFELALFRLLECLFAICHGQITR